MSKKVIDVDDEALAAAAKYYGTTSMRETVNNALREVAQRMQRREALDRLVEIASTGELDSLLDKRNYRR